MNTQINRIYVDGGNGSYTEYKPGTRNIWLAELRGHGMTRFTEKQTGIHESAKQNTLLILT